MRFTAPLALLLTFLTASAQAQSVAFPGPGMTHTTGCPATATWNPSDKGANITLSGGNLSASGATAFNSVRATSFQSNGKWYWENKVTAVTGAASVVGFGNSAMSLTNFVGNSVTSVGIQTSGSTSVSAGFTSAVATGVTWAANDFQNFAIDLAAGKLWFGKNGTWTSGNPVTGTLPNVTFTGGSLSLFPAWSSADASNTGTANFGATAFNGTVPSGFHTCFSNISITNIGTLNNTAGATIALTGVTVPASSLIVVGVCEYNAGAGGTGTVADGTNTYTLIKAASPNGIYGQCQIFSAPSASLTSGTITYTKNTSASVTSISAFYATGMVSQAADSAVSASATGNSSSPSVTSGIPSVTGELFVALCGQNDVIGPVGAYTQDTTNGWATPFVEIDGGANPVAGVAGGNQINGSTAAVTFSPTLGGGGGNWAAIIVGFKP